MKTADEYAAEAFAAWQGSGLMSVMKFRDMFARAQADARRAAAHGLKQAVESIIFGGVIPNGLDSETVAWLQDYAGRVKQAKAADARRATLEEAAKVADRFKGDVRYPMTADHIADEIRALLDSAGRG